MHIIKWKKSIRKDYIVYNFTYLTSYIRQNYENSKGISGCHRLWGGTEKQGEHRELSGQRNSSVWCRSQYMLLYICQIYSHITPRVKSNVDDSLWVIMMCLGRFIACKFAHLVGDVYNAGDYVCIEAVMWENYLFFSIFLWS